VAIYRAPCLCDLAEPCLSPVSPLLQGMAACGPPRLCGSAGADALVQRRVTVTDSEMVCCSRLPECMCSSPVATPGCCLYAGSEQTAIHAVDCLYMQSLNMHSSAQLWMSLQCYPDETLVFLNWRHGSKCLGSSSPALPPLRRVPLPSAGCSVAHFCSWKICESWLSAMHKRTHLYQPPASHARRTTGKLESRRSAARARCARRASKRCERCKVGPHCG